MVIYPLVMTDSLLLKMAIEIADLPINSMVIFHSYVAVYHLVMTNTSPWKIQPFLRTVNQVNHLFRLGPFSTIYTMAMLLIIRGYQQFMAISTVLVTHEILELLSVDRLLPVEFQIASSFSSHMVGADQIWCRDMQGHQAGIWLESLPIIGISMNSSMIGIFDDFWVSFLFQAVIIEFSAHTQCNNWIINISKHPVPVRCNIAMILMIHLW